MAVFDAFAGGDVGDLPFKKCRGGIAAQRGIALPCLKNRTPKDVEQKNHARHEPKGPPTARHLTLANQQCDHATNRGHHHPLQDLLR